MVFFETGTRLIKVQNTVPVGLDEAEAEYAGWL